MKIEFLYANMSREQNSPKLVKLSPVQTFHLHVLEDGARPARASAQKWRTITAEPHTTQPNRRIRSIVYFCHLA